MTIAVAWMVMIGGAGAAAWGAVKVWTAHHDETDAGYEPWWTYVYGLRNLRDQWPNMLMWTGGMLAVLVGIGMLQ